MAKKAGSGRITLEELDSELLEEFDAPSRRLPDSRRPERFASERLDLDSIVAGLEEPPSRRALSSIPAPLQIPRSPAMTRPGEPLPLPPIPPSIGSLESPLPMPMPPPARRAAASPGLSWGGVAIVSGLMFALGGLTIWFMDGRDRGLVAEAAPAEAVGPTDPAPLARDLDEGLDPDAPVEADPTPAASAIAPSAPSVVQLAPVPLRAGADQEAPARTEGRRSAPPPPIRPAPRVAPELERVAATTTVEPVVAAEPVAAAEPVVAAEPVAAAEPVVAAEPVTPTGPPEPMVTLPAQPTRADVEAAIGRAAPAIRSCAPGLGGHVAQIRFRFASSGQATMAVVEGHTLEGAQRSCMARAARSARVPAFSDPQLVVTYPLTL